MNVDIGATAVITMNIDMEMTSLLLNTAIVAMAISNALFLISIPFARAVVVFNLKHGANFYYIQRAPLIDTQT